MRFSLLMTGAIPRTRIPGHFRRAAALALGLAVLASLAVPLRAQTLPGTESRKLKQEEPERSIEQAPTVVESVIIDSLYIVGPGDILHLTVFTERFYAYDVVVSSNGRIVVPMIGEISVQNQSLAAVREMLKSVVDRSFRNAELTVSLARPRSIRVSVTGAVQHPGLVTLSATARVTDALQAAGGIIRDTTAIRGIAVRRGTATLTADLAAFHRLGDAGANPFLSSGDVIFFPRIDERISVFGAVDFEGHIDYCPGEYLFDYIRLAGGFRSSVFLDSVQIIRFASDNITATSMFLDLRGYPDNQASNILMQPSDFVFLRSIPKFRRHYLVLVKGEAMYPGTYPIEPAKTRLTDIIRAANGFTSEASLEEATVTRKADENERDREYERLSKIPPADMQEDEYEYFKARSRERYGQMVVDFKRLFLEGDAKEDILLQDGDLIEIPIRKNFIRVIGRVNNPGNVIYRESWLYTDYITASGGFGWRANEGDVRVVKARTGELMDAESIGDYTLEPGDAIWVPEEARTKFWEVALTTLGVLSQVAGIVGIVVAISRL